MLNHIYLIVIYKLITPLHFLCNCLKFSFLCLHIHYRCEECGSMFAIKSRLQTHKNTVHSERVHMCNVCDKTFQSQSLVKRHMFIHSRVKPYSCPFCNHSSNSQSNLTKHVRNIHSKDGFSYHKSVLHICFVFLLCDGRLELLIIFLYRLQVHKRKTVINHAQCMSPVVTILSYIYWI